MSSLRQIHKEAEKEQSRRGVGEEAEERKFGFKEEVMIYNIKHSLETRQMKTQNSLHIATKIRY